MVALEAGYLHTVGLKSVGIVMAVGNNKHGQCDVALERYCGSSRGSNHTIALKSDGTVAVGSNAYGQCNVSDWNDIVAIAAGCAVGLKSDGTVVAVGDNTYGQCDISSWCNIRLPGK